MTFFKYGHDLYQRANFNVSLFRSDYITFEVAGREKAVGLRIIFLFFSSCKLLLENNFDPFRQFCSFMPSID